MKHLLSLLLLFLSLGSLSAQTELYNKYAHRKDVKVACITNFALNDTTTTNVTVVSAIDSAGWQWMCDEFSISPLSDQQRDDLLHNRDVVMFAMRDAGHPGSEVKIFGENLDNSHSCYMGVSYLSQTVFIFSYSSDTQVGILVDYMIEKVKRSRN